LSSTNSELRNATGGIIRPRPNEGAIIACDTSLLIGSVTNSENGGMLRTGMIANNNCILQRARTDQCFIGGSIDSDIRTNLGNGTGIKGILGCDNTSLTFGRTSFLACQDTTIPTGQSDLFNSYISCNNISHSNEDFNTFFSSNDVLFGSRVWSLIKATNADIQHSRVVVLSDDDTSGPRLTTLAGNSFVTRFTGGERFYTNSALTTYADLAAGTGAWVAVSDRNLKENLKDVVYDDVLGRVKDLPIYKYNFIGNPKETKCIGAMAQDWHAIVTPTETYTVLEDDPDKGEKKEVKKDAKNKLGIEEMDSIGVCLSAIKSLDKKVQVLTKINELKSQKIKTLEDKIKKIRELRSN
jgi:hypothetical protein